MTEYAFVKPVNGGRIRQPDRGSVVLPDSGGWVPRIQYYEALIATKNLVVAEPPQVDALSEERPASNATEKTERKRH